MFSIFSAVYFLPAHNDRLLHVGDYPTGILSTCDRCLGEYLLVLQVNEARSPARS
jgi:hypothetical protein